MNVRSVNVAGSGRKADQYGLFLAVLPRYRAACIAAVQQRLGNSVRFWVSPAHLDPTVKSDVANPAFELVPMARILGKVFFQAIPARALSVSSLVIDLNPRSISAWTLLLGRRLLGKRTLVWGHIHPQAGSASKTAALRRLMRRLAQGTITYTYRDAAKARADLPDAPIWVAPNSLYPRELIVTTPSAERHEILYVGRFEPAKKVGLLVEGFARALKANPTIRLRLVGGGSEEAKLLQRVAEMGLTDQITFEGWVNDPAKLAVLFAQAFASASPGFAGLGLTQSLGFGVPQIVAESEPHSPEIELADESSVVWFASDSPEALAAAIATAWARRASLPVEELSASVREAYSAEAMAEGLVGALTDTRPANSKGTLDV